MNEDIKDKVKGIIFGQAIGDALGLGTEFLTKKQVAELYPDGYDYYDQMVRDKHRKRWAIKTSKYEEFPHVLFRDIVINEERILKALSK